MENLDKLREQIDKIDKELIVLYEKRLDLVGQVAQYKKQSGTNVLQQSRENIVLENAVNNLTNKDYSYQAQELMTSIMDISKDMQRQVTSSPQNYFERENINRDCPKGYFGEKGSNSHQALIDILGDKNSCGYDSFVKMLEALKNNEIKYAVLPIENSSTGAINQVYDLLAKYDFYIIGEKWEKISHNLYGIKGASLENITTIYSHPQALEQCDQFLENKGWTLLPYYSTSSAAKMLSNQKNSQLGVIANDYAGELYGLEKLASGIHTNKENYTRFVVLSSSLTNGQNNKISLLFNLVSKPGTLYNVLRYFAKYQINMVKIESRPVKNNPCNYFFYVDLEGNCQDENMNIALDYVKQNSNVFKFLGEYKKDEIK